jgi:ribose transport system substrate-binding protein
MVKRLRKGFAIVAGLVLVVSVAVLTAGYGGSNIAEAGARATSPTSAKQIRIGFVAPLANAYIQGELRGIEGVVKRNPGVKLVKVDSAFNATQQYNALQDAITQRRFDGFVILPVDPVNLVPVIKQAIKAGIKVVSINAQLGPNSDALKPQIKGQSGSALDPHSLRGKWRGELMIKACKGIDPCKVGWLTVSGFYPPAKVEEDVARKMIAKHKNIKIVATLPASESTAAVGQTLSQDMLTAHPDLNVIAGDDQLASGVAISVAAAGRTGKVKVLGAGGSEIAKRLILKGQMWGSYISYPEDEGRLGAKILLQAIRGQLKAPKGISPGLERIKAGQSPLLTKQNVKKFKPQFPG